MLILTRKVGERVHIGDDVVVKVLQVNGNQVRLGIEAPRSTPVFRHEIHERIQEERREAKAHAVG